MSSGHEQAAIIAETQAFAEAWNRGDAAAAASFFGEDGVRVGAFGDVQRGRAEIEVAYERLLHTSMPGARVKQERGTVRMLTTELAVWQGGIEIVPPNGGASLRGHVVQVMRKDGERWLIAESHPKLFPAPPAPATAWAPRRTRTSTTASIRCAWFPKPRVSPGVRSPRWKRSAGGHRPFF